MRKKMRLTGVTALVTGMVLFAAGTAEVRSGNEWFKQDGTVGPIKASLNTNGGWVVKWREVKGALGYKIKSETGWEAFAGGESRAWKIPENIALNPGRAGTQISVQPVRETNSGKRVVWGKASTELLCSQYTFIGVRGSGQNSEEEGSRGGLGDRAWNSFTKAQTLAGVGNSFIRAVALAYPANRADTWDGMLTYPTSSRLGGVALRDSLIKWSRECPESQFMLYGYSQGADIIATTWVGLSQDIKDKIVGIYLLGDPRYNPQDSSAKSVNAIKPGPLGARDALNEPKINSWCAVEDVVCQKSIDNLWNLKNRVHGHYYDKIQETAARLIAQNLTQKRNAQLTRPE